MLKAIETVTLNAGRPLEINPTLVAAVEPNEMKPETSTFVYVIGARFKVRGHCNAIKKALGFNTVSKIGFDEVLPGNPEPQKSGKPGKPGFSERK